MRFGAYLFYIRQKKKISSIQFSARSGYARSTLREIERGTCLPPSEYDIKTICDVLIVTPKQRKMLFRLALQAHIDKVRRRYKGVWPDVAKAVLKQNIA
ncbi:MAG: XRE family transcriptional regulator, partial [Proteobacteria bacterium]